MHRKEWAVVSLLPSNTTTTHTLPQAPYLPRRLNGEGQTPRAPYLPTSLTVRTLVEVADGIMVTIVDFNQEEHFFWLMVSDTNGVGARRWKQILSSGKAYTAVSSDGKVAGLAVCARGKTAAGCELYWVYVFEDFRSQGVGQALVEKVRHCFPHVFLHVETDNIEAIKLYQKCGFSCDENDSTNGLKEPIKIQNVPLPGCTSFRMRVPI